MLYSIGWIRQPCKFQKQSKTPNVIDITTTFLDERGRVISKTFKYEEWLGVCTSRINRVIEQFKANFPNHTFHYELLGESKKILPYFEQRLKTGKLDYKVKPFYKIYSSTALEDVGRFFRRYKISYYDKADWLVRVYIDLCTRYDTRAFYYKWYDVTENEYLMDALHMRPDRTDAPDWTIGAFDFETVPMDGAEDRIPTGLDASDKIVMISLYRWNKRKGVKSFLLYLLPDGASTGLEFSNAYAYTSEEKMLRDFHALLEPCQVLTGYNINGFDFPCVFARLLFLQQFDILAHYSSSNIGTEVVTTFKHKMVLDMYPYFRTFSGYDLPGFKLDDVAHVKLKTESKIPVKSTGIWYWYTRKNAGEWIDNDSVDACHQHLQPRNVPLHQFGTFRTYLEYCLKDSELVYKLFEKEMMLSFLVERANFTSLNAMDALHMGNSRFLLELFKTYGTRLGFFVNMHFFKNNLNEIKYASMYISNRNTYQGALNFCVFGKGLQRHFRHGVMDFSSMYPSALLSSNLDYGTCTIFTKAELQACPLAQSLTVIPYRVHSDEDFEQDAWGPDPQFRYPRFNPEKDTFAIVINQNTPAFLPCIVQHFLELRKHHQGQWKKD
ncbi:DNA polymerase [Caerostris extrusa]|uniref:DNA polymerase delta catalytic subunit n=1 Tax=Caerostris extrusa TaxID=172846 RepID=A0AAV4XSQ5_CAEEX|nr:DNA polymerase [Caerostris extrusa]